jgi:hypothetical protein
MSNNCHNTCDTRLIFFLIVMTSMRGSVDLTGGDWTKKKIQRQNREKLGSGGSDTSDERCWGPPSTSKHIYLYSMYGKAEFSWVQ